MTKLAAHVQAWSAATEDHLKRALYPAVKFMTDVDPTIIRDKVLPAYERAGRPKPFLWPRKWTDDITKDCVQQGAAGAKRWRDAVISDYSKARSVLGCTAVELDNEVICQSDDDAKRHNAFEAEVVRLLASDGFQAIALNAAVGWPKLEHWRYYREILVSTAYLGLHEYGWPALNQDGIDLRYFEWHVGRWRKAADTIRSLGYRLPPILMTEIGWDGALLGLGHRGFRTGGISQTAYLEWLQWYDRQIVGDSRVVYASIFQTGAKSDWKEMDAVGSEIDSSLADYVRNSYSQEINWARVEAILGEEAQKYVIPLNKDSAFEKAAAARGLMAVSPEFDCTVDGILFRAQVYRGADRSIQHIVAAVVGQWDKLHWWTRRN